MKLKDIVSRSPVPQPWQEGEKIPWDDPGFSRRMLEEHLDQEHDLASRRLTIIDQHVDWIHLNLLNNSPGKILDLGCGPGFYTTRLAERGHTCRGIDFSPASIEYARQTVAARNLSCEYIQDDIRRADFGSAYDLVMLIYGELNTFRPSEARAILEKARQSLNPGGWLLLEVSAFQSTFNLGHQPPTWFSAASGLFSDQPHLVLYESFWDEDLKTATERYFVIHAGDDEATISQITASQQAYKEDELLELLGKIGFRDIRIMRDFPVQVASGPAFLFVRALR
jgi:SAM-dependent methyltransferase